MKRDSRRVGVALVQLDKAGDAGLVGEEPPGARIGVHVDDVREHERSRHVRPRARIQHPPDLKRLGDGCEQTHPIAGMPILDVDKAGAVVVIKRSLSPGFAGIPNPLFAADNTLMLFGDGREAVVDITRSLAEV